MASMAISKYESKLKPEKLPHVTANYVWYMCSIELDQSYFLVWLALSKSLVVTITNTHGILFKIC